MDPTILITGASSGLGLAFVKHYCWLSLPCNIIALDNRPFPSSETTPEVHFHQIDITSAEHVRELASNLNSSPINLIIHCAGVRGLVKEVVEEEKGGEKNVAATEMLDVMDKETMMKTFEINTWGTLNIVRSFLPGLRLAAQQAVNEYSRNAAPKVVIMSSR